jgi:two-component system OmpR family sensor kinase
VSRALSIRFGALGIRSATRWDNIVPKTLRARLTFAYASALIAALAVFAVIALAVIDTAQHGALDRQLESTAGALQIVGDVRGSLLVIDAGDRAQFHAIVGTKAQSAIVARDGTIVVSTDDRMARALALHMRDAVVASFADVRADGQHVRVYAAPFVAHGRVLAQTLTWGDVGAIASLDRSVALAFAIAIPIVALLAIVAGGEIARRGLAPLERMARLASEIEAHDLTRRLELPARRDELGKFAGTFDRMLDRLQSAFERERRFTSDASHELRAPLSVIRAEADLTLRSERSAEEYRNALETIASESDALEMLTRDLLAAARNGSDTEDVRGPVDLSSVATVVAQRMAVLASTRSVQVREITERDALVRGNRALIERAVVSVLHNALKYAPDRGSVEIRVAVDGTHAELTVGDDGPGFSNVALERGFDRFWRDDASRAREGSGLGLSLAKTIVERYGGTIALANIAPHGALVRMSFPAAFRENELWG